MDRETENEEKNGSVVSEETSSHITVNGIEQEGVPDEVVASDHDEENSESMKATEEPPGEGAAASEPEEEEVLGDSDITTIEDLDAKMNKVNEQPMSHDDLGSPRLHLESPERQNTSPAQEDGEAEEEGSTAAPADQEDISHEYMQLHQELCEDRDKAGQHHSMLQMKLVEFFRKKARDNVQLDRDIPVSEQQQQQEYEKYMNILTDLKQQLGADSETAQQQAEEWRFKSKEKLDEVENEWQAFMALKQDVAVTVLSRRLGKPAAQARVEATLATEKHLQHELTQLRHKHIKMRMKIHRLEAELHEGEEHARDPLHLKFEQLQAERLELKKQTEKQNEESLKIQKKISGSLELLSNVKEKLFWGKMEVQAKREELAMMEANVARKRDLLTRTRHARNGLQRDNMRLKEHRGLLGNRVLLRDFEDTVDATDQLEEQLEVLKYRQAEIVFRCGGWKKKP